MNTMPFYFANANRITTLVIDGAAWTLMPARDDI